MFRGELRGAVRGWRLLWKWMLSFAQRKQKETGPIVSNDKEPIVTEVESKTEIEIQTDNIVDNLQNDANGKTDLKICPFCAEEIKIEAIKCKYCGEWLKEIDKESLLKKNKILLLKNVTAKININLEDIGNNKLLYYITIIPISILAVDFLFNLNSYNMRQLLTQAQQELITYLLLTSVGIIISSYIYNVKKIKLIILFSIINLYVIRIIIVSIFFNLFLLSEVVANTTYEVVFLFGALIIFAILFRFFEPVFNFANIDNIVTGHQDPILKKKYDIGTCSKCKKITRIAKERFISFLGKSDYYFCDNCGIFIRGNPVKNICLGLSEGILSIVLVISLVSNFGVSKQSSWESVLLLLFIYGVFDGVKRTLMSLCGLKIMHE